MPNKVRLASLTQKGIASISIFSLALSLTVHAQNFDVGRSLQHAGKSINTHKSEHRAGDYIATPLHQAPSPNCAKPNIHEARVFGAHDDRHVADTILQQGSLSQKDKGDAINMTFSVGKFVNPLGHPPHVELRGTGFHVESMGFEGIGNCSNIVTAAHVLFRPNGTPKRRFVYYCSHLFQKLREKCYPKDLIKIDLLSDRVSRLARPDENVHKDENRHRDAVAIYIGENLTGCVSLNIFAFDKKRNLASFNGAIHLTGYHFDPSHTGKPAVYFSTEREPGPNGNLTGGNILLGSDEQKVFDLFADRLFNEEVIYFSIDDSAPGASGAPQIIRYKDEETNETKYALGGIVIGNTVRLRGDTAAKKATKLRTKFVERFVKPNINLLPTQEFVDFLEAHMRKVQKELRRR